MNVEIRRILAVEQQHSLLQEMTDALSEDIRDRMMGNIPMKRFGTPADVADVVMFLAGDSSAYMTGQVLTVSGGMVM